MAHTTGGSEKTDGGKRPRARSGGGCGLFFVCFLFLPEVREFIKDTRPKTNTTRGGRKARLKPTKQHTEHSTRHQGTAHFKQYVRWKSHALAVYKLKPYKSRTIIAKRRQKILLQDSPT